jgi:hypothetical protein
MGHSGYLALICPTSVIQVEETVYQPSRVQTDSKLPSPFYTLSLHFAPQPNRYSGLSIFQRSTRHVVFCL